MSAVLSQAQSDLSEQIAEIRDRIERLQTKQRSVDKELERIAVEREQHQLLSSACEALKKLEAQGVAHLFWGERTPIKDTAAHLARVRDVVTAFAEKVDAIEQRRRAIQTDIEKQTDQFYLLNQELLEEKEREENEKYEFIVSRELKPETYHPAVMPWSEGGEDRRRFRKSMLLALLLTLLFGGGIGIWQLPIREQADPADIPERLVELVQREKPKPPEPKPVEQVKKDSPEKPAQTETQQARQKAEQSGVLAFKNAFKELMDEDASDKLGASANITNSGQPAAGDARRSLITAQARAGSGGINTASISRNVGGTGNRVGGVEFSRVESSVSGMKGGDRPLSDGAGPTRTDEEIQIVFDRYKATLYRIYNRELRSDPTLRGKMVLRITIEPNGEVSAAKIESTDMASATLKDEVLDRVKRMNFGPKDGVPRLTILYPIDFLPAT